MDHTHYQELVSQFVDGELGAEGEQELFAHLAMCRDCRDFYKKALLLQEDLRATKVSLTDPPHARRASNVLRSVWNRRVPMSIAAALALFGLISTITLSTFLLGPKEKVVEPKEDVVYVPRLPAIQVIGFYSTTATPDK